ncbi:MAG TPA: KTSC domain-containing protein [Ferruginibacter sp.]|nr:KTSC domain-containing protein [Ferruginibacter sp.]
MKTLFICLLLLSHFNSHSQDCKGLPSRYSSSSEAINRVKNSSFVLKDKLPDGKSEKIVSANYYSCDGEFGYMVYVYGKRARSFIHAQVPKNIWLEFKNAPSSEAYYDSNIRDKYKIELKQTNL